MKPFPVLTDKVRRVEPLRWICVLPAAWLGDYAGLNNLALGLGCLAARRAAECDRIEIHTL